MKHRNKIVRLKRYKETPGTGANSNLFFYKTNQLHLPKK